MKRFLLFSWFRYEQNGGWNDLHGAFDTVVESAIAANKTLDTLKHQWHVVDTTTMEIVATSL